MEEAELDTSVVQRVRDQVAAEDLLQASTAFYRWREISLKANFKKKLVELLDDINEEEGTHTELRKRHSELTKK